MNKKDLSERDIITQFIMPAIKKAGWNIEKQIREEVYFTDGRIYVKGNKTARGERKFADIILSKHLKNIFEEGELQKEEALSKMETVQNEGGSHYFNERNST